MSEETRVANAYTRPCSEQRNIALPISVLLIGLSLGIPLCGAEDVEPIPPVVLFTKFQVEPPGAVISSLRDELAAIMRPVGIRFEWRPVPTVGPSEVAAALAVVTFKGRCELSGAEPLQPGTRVLGLTYSSEGVIIPFSDIDCDGIRNFIHSDLILERPERRNRRYARAIARVLAHELYHILANTAEHGQRGLAKPIYRASDLLADDLQFDRRNLSALRNGKIVLDLKNSARVHHSIAAAAAAESEAAH